MHFKSCLRGFFENIFLACHLKYHPTSLKLLLVDISDLPRTPPDQDTIILPQPSRAMKKLYTYNTTYKTSKKYLALRLQMMPSV